MLEIIADPLLRHMGSPMPTRDELKAARVDADAYVAHNKDLYDGAIRGMDEELGRLVEALRGRYGRTVSALRPAGVTEFDGKRVDTMSEGQMIDPGVWVRCIDVKSGTVIVRQVDKPPDLANMETADLQ